MGSSIVEYPEDIVYLENNEPVIVMSNIYTEQGREYDVISVEKRAGAYYTKGERFTVKEVYNEEEI